jgi:hypothetical protein
LALIFHPVALELFLELEDFLQLNMDKDSIKTVNILSVIVFFISILLRKSIKFRWCNITNIAHTTMLF